MPHGAIRALWACRAPEVLVDGPAGTGKTRGVLEKGVLATLKYPGARVLLTRKTRASLTESVLVTLEDKVLGRESPVVEGAHRRFRHSYDLPNGSQIIVGGMDNSDRIMSTEYDLILAFEATELHEDDWEKLTTRLRNGAMPYQQAIADCNPAGPSHWLKRRADEGRMVRLPSRHEDNPVLWNGADWTAEGQRYLQTLDALTGHRHGRLRLGQWVAAEGMVYPEFDAAVHVIDEMPAGWETWTKHRSVDFGFTNPFVCQWWAEDNDGRLYLYREVYQTQRTVGDHSGEITRLDTGEKISRTVADHDAEDRATLQAAGIPSEPARKDVSPGIQAVSRRLRKAGDGKPRLFFLRNALVERDAALKAASRPTCTLEEIEGYCWARGADGKPVKEEPVKVDDHGCDAMRYMVMALESAPYFATAKMAGEEERKTLDELIEARNRANRAWDNCEDLV